MLANRCALVAFAVLAELLTTTATDASDNAKAPRSIEPLWQAVLTTTPRPATWAGRRHAFETGLGATPAGGQREAHLRDLVQRLRTERRTAARMPRRVKTFGSGCLGRALRDCKVLDTGRLASDGPEIRWQTQRGFTNEDGTRGGMVLLERAGSGLVVIGWSFEGHDWQQPKLITGGGERLLTAPGRTAGTGAYNADLLYRRVGTTWREVDLESWQTDIDKHLPAGFGVWKGVDYDFATMTATTRVWRPDDANCCPTGGDATASLRIDGDQLVLTGLDFKPQSNAR